MRKISSFLLTLCILSCTQEPKDASEPGKRNSEIQVSYQWKDLEGIEFYNSVGGLLNSDVLQQAGELSMNDSNSENNIIRITVKPTFGKPIVMKMYQNNRGESFISIKRLSGLGGYELGHIEMMGNVSITREYFDSILEQTKDADLIGLSKMTLEQRLQTASLDGSWWSVEILSDQGLKVIDLHSPEPIGEDATGLSPYLTKKAVANLIKLVTSISDPIGLIIDGVNDRGHQ